MTNNHLQPEGRFERIVDALRELPVPAAPDEAFRQRLVDRLRACDDSVLSSDLATQQRRPVMRRIVVLAASVLIVSAVIGWIASFSGAPAGSAFGRMLEQVTNARTVVFKGQVEIGDPPHRMQTKMMLLEPDWMREETVEGENDKTIHIHNRKQRKWLTLIPISKTARLRTIEAQSSPQPTNMIEQIRQVRESSAEFLGRESINGKDTLKYRHDHPTGHYLLWIAPATDLPVKVVMSESGDDAKGFVTITLTDFEWNVPLNESLFTLVPPEGYKLEQEPLEKSVLDPENFIAILKAYVRLNNGQFPDELNALTPGSMIKFLDDPTLPPEERMANYQRKIAHALERPEVEQMSKEEWQKLGREVGRMFAQGAAFLPAIAQTHDWHYIGKGVKLGESDKIVAWWGPKDVAGRAPQTEQSKSATVLYGDLHVETKPVAGLPTGD